MEIGCAAKQKLSSSHGIAASPPVERMLSEAPTVTTFFAVPGASSKSGSTTPSPPVEAQRAGGAILARVASREEERRIRVIPHKLVGALRAIGVAAVCAAVSVIGPVMSPQLVAQARRRHMPAKEHVVVAGLIDGGVVGPRLERSDHRGRPPARRLQTTCRTDAAPG